MRRHLSALAALAVAGSLAGSALAVPATAATAPAAPASAARITPSPQSPLKATVYYNKYVRRGGSFTYTIKSKNVGEWPTDFAGLLAILPKGASKTRVVSKSSSTVCDIEKRELICFFDTLKPGRTTTVKVKVWLKRSTKGSVYGEFGTFSVDVPGGVDITNPEELDKLDLAQDIKYLKVRTKIIR
ncbi:hypothetical protein [Sphaerisporangium aureirubrum]|uniref:DUF11 domain-containing protein n=1 Tax=Sphaerisporangium aureirubrum TaxID=1544736 RepID=A0ABW1N937_9ACTN